MESDIISEFESQLLAAWPWESWRDLRVLVAVSGGPDSVALLTAIARITNTQDATTRKTRGQPATVGSVEVAHFNHRWRGEAADADASFVRDLAARYQFSCYVGTAQIATGVRSEQAARRARYDFLTETALQRGARYVAFGHTFDDQVETVLHRILRGTGLSGLAGIPATRRLHEAVTAVRPMLAISRKVVLEYLSSHDQSSRIDASNTDVRYTRNAIRHDLLPRLRHDYNARVDDALARLARLAAENELFLTNLVEPLLDRCVLRQSNTCLELSVGEIACHPELLQRQILTRLWRQQGWPEQGMGLEQWQRLRDLCNDTAESLALPGRIRAYRRESTLCIKVDVGE